MSVVKSGEVISEVKSLFDKMGKHTEEAQLDSLLSYYDNSPTFLAFSSDGTMRNYDEFRKICTEYYTKLQSQKLTTTTERFNVIDSNLVIVGWTGKIVAQFKNGDMMSMNNYSVTNVFRRIDGKWKVIHDHESALPPDIVKKG
jgi:ketosteroid isomerase-like protein